MRELEQAFRDTVYEAGALRLRVDEPSPALDALLDAHGARAFAYLTAWNPGARPSPRERNEAAQARLRERLAPHVVVEGSTRAQDPSQDEPSLLVIGIARDEAVALARAFGQLALLVGERGGAPQLVWLD